jgi:hypothetical protein
MAQHVRSADLALMSTEERDIVLGRLVESATGPRNGQRAEIEARIRRFELRYEIASEQLLTELATGTRKETAEIAEWLFWLRVRDDSQDETRP